MSFSFFVLGFLVVPNVAWWVWADRRLRGRRVARTAFAVFMAPLVGMVAWIALHPSARDAHHYLPEWWLVLTYVWHLLVLPVVLVALLVRGLFVLVRICFGRRGRTAMSAEVVREHRRPFLKSAVVALPPVAAVAAMVRSFPELHSFHARGVELPVAALPAALDGLCIAHVSDLHYGKYTDPTMIDRLVAAVNGMQADLVLLTGDLIDLSLRDLPGALRFLGRLDRRSGLYLCEGNHDRIEDGVVFEREVRAAGFGFLRDESATVALRGERVQIHGVRWAGPEKEIERHTRRLNDRRDPEAFSILLAHHPHCFDHARDIPLTLAGHTHGGQLMINERLGAGSVLFRYWSGVYRNAERCLVVSNGAGNWFPLRTAAAAEVTRLVLRSGT